MLSYTSEKKSAYFHVFGPELFFEAEALDMATLMGDLRIDIEMDQALKTLLGESEAADAA